MSIRRDQGPSGIDRAIRSLQGLSPAKVRGRVTALGGLVLRATLPNARVGEYVRILRRHGEALGAEVVGFSTDDALLMPLGDAVGVGPDSLVEATGQRPAVLCGPGLLGRILGGLGQPIDDGPPIDRPLEALPIDRSAPSPLSRSRIVRPLSVGVRAIDALLTIGEGQRIGLFAGSGVGKSMLLGQLARQADADVCVICLIGERGREVQDFIDESLGSGLSHSVVVCATSDAPPLVRLKSALVATTIAESFRDERKRVLLLMDSVTRYARALREVGLACGEPPARRGYPPSVFAALPRLLERAGATTKGSITAVYTVLVEGGDLDEPVADEVRGILDGHIVLDRQLAERGHWPAIDTLRSLSRLMNRITSDEQQRAAARLRELLASYEKHRDLIVLGAYQQGSDPKTDRAIRMIDPINAFLQQRADEHVPLAESQQALIALLSDADGARS